MRDHGVSSNSSTVCSGAGAKLGSTRALYHSDQGMPGERKRERGTVLAVSMESLRAVLHDLVVDRS